MAKERRTKNMNIPLTASEKDKLEAAAEKSGLSLSAFVRRKLLYEGGVN